MRLSIIVPVLNSHEIVRRQLLHFAKIGLGDMPDVELIYVDDGSDPPITSGPSLLSNLHILYTRDTRPWTWALARNFGAKAARGDYFLMCDLDYILSRKLIDRCLDFKGDRLGFKREFGILDEHGDFTQDIPTLLKYGLLASRIPKKGLHMPPHPNSFCMRAGLYWDLGGYREDLFMKPYPQGEDRWFKRALVRACNEGRATMDNTDRPTIYMFPIGQFCEGKDVDADPMHLFHSLSRKTPFNPWHTNEKGRG